MRGIILAAGRGSRMGQLTDDKPKCLTEIAGHTLLSLQRAALRDAGVEHVGIVAGYRREMLTDHGLELLLNERWAESNMVVSLTCASSWLRTSPCLVSYADIFYSAAIARRLVENADDIAVTFDPAWNELWSGRFEDPLSDAETFKISNDGWITEIGRKPTAIEEIQGQYMGLLRFTPQGWKETEDYLATLPTDSVDRLDMTTLLMRLIESGIRIRGVAIAGDWGEVDSGSDLAFYEAKIRAGALRL